MDPRGLFEYVLTTLFRLKVNFVRYHCMIQDFSMVQDYNMYAWCTSAGPVPGVPYYMYRTNCQVLDSYAYGSLFIGPEPADRKQRLLLVIG